MAGTNGFHRKSVDLEKLVCVSDFEKAAQVVLPCNTYEYYKSGADEENVLAENKRAYKRWFIKPRVLRDVSIRSLNSNILNVPVCFPIGVSPTAMHKLAHPLGELAVAKAVEQLGSIFIVSNFSTYSIEEIATAAPKARKWLQLSVFKHRNISAALVKRSEAAGFEAIVLSVDVPMVGKRRETMRQKFALAEDLELPSLPKNPFVVSQEDSSLFNVDEILDQSMTWQDLYWLRSITKLPIILKGIMCPEDAKLAIMHGASGIFVSNHGGRQLDAVSATIEALPAIVRKVAGRCEVYVDGGISTGADVFKALALGANMVFIGRPVLWGLSVGGQKGAQRVLEILRDELDLTMALSGTPEVTCIDSTCLTSAVHHRDALDEIV